MIKTKSFSGLLSEGDLRSIANNDLVISQIHSRADFDVLFRLVFDPGRLVVMRAVDAIEKITRDKPQYLSKHAKQIFRLRHVATTKELKWHLALLIPRLVLNKEKLDLACQILTMWALDNTNSHIVRVNSLQGLYELSTRYKTAINDFMTVLAELEKENIPSVNARIRILKKHMRS